MILLNKKDYLSIDIGGTNIKYGLLDRSGKLISKGKVSTKCTDILSFKQLIDSIVEPRLSNVRGIAISVPGKVDVHRGVVYYGGSLPYLDGFDFYNYFRKKYNLQCSVENDGKAAALAELWLGKLKERNDGIVLVLGTGVGGGIVINRQLYRGVHFQAGELSFMPTTSDFSTMNDFVGVYDSAVEMIKRIATSLELSDKTDGVAVFEAIKNGNSVAQKIFKEYCKRIATLILSIEAVLDMDRVVIGGGISAQSILIDEINNQIKQLFRKVSMVSETLTLPQVVQAHFQNDANLYGALYALLQRVDDVNGEISCI